MAMRGLGPALATALLLVGCGGSSAGGDKAAGDRVPTVAAVVRAMQAQPRMLTRMAGTSVQRAVVDGDSRYLALSSSGVLLAMEKDGVQYRLGEGCYHRSKATPIDTRILWASWLLEVMGSRHAARVSGDTVVFKSATGSLTVDLHSNRIRSAVKFALPSRRIRRSSVTFSYPGSVTQLPRPVHICP
jgi:hypothetical protein